MNPRSLKSVLVILAQILGPFGQIWVFHKFGWVFHNFTENGEFYIVRILTIRHKNRDACHWYFRQIEPPGAQTTKITTNFFKLIFFINDVAKAWLTKQGFFYLCIFWSIKDCFTFDISTEGVVTNTAGQRSRIRNIFLLQNINIACAVCMYYTDTVLKTRRLICCFFCIPTVGIMHVPYPNTPMQLFETTVL